MDRVCTDLPPFNGTTFRGRIAPAVSFLPRRSLWLWRGLIGLRLHGKRMGRSDRGHAGFHLAGYLLEDLAGLAATENLRSDCFVLGHKRHGRLAPTLVINPSGRPSGCAMHSEGITNGFGADAQGRCDGLAALAHLMRRASRCVAHEKHRKAVEKRGYRDPRISVFSVRASNSRRRASITP